MFNMFQRFLPRTEDFFSLFEAHVATLVAASEALKAVVDGEGDRGANLAIIHDREHDADDLIRDVLRAVRRTFLTPFDRGAITSLIAAMDDAIDEMQSTARAIELYDYSTFEGEMQQMMGMIADGVRQIAEALPLMRDLTRNGAKVHQITERVVRLEGEADIVHAAGLKRAYQSFGPTDPMGFIVRREIYKHLERITDALEDVANEIDGIVIDHA